MPIAEPKVSPDGTSAPPDDQADHKAGSWYVLSRPRFGVYFAGSLLSNVGTWLQNTAQMLLAYQLTHSALAVGLVSMAQFSGFVVLGPWAAALPWRFGGRRTLVATQVVSAVVAGGMAVMRFDNTLTEPWLIAGALGIGLAFTFALPVQSSMASRLVPDTDTKAAMAMNSVSYNAGRTLAPVLAVVLLFSIGGGWAFALNALSFLTFAIVVLTIYPADNWQPAPRKHGWTGVRIVVSRPRILLLLAMIAAVTLAEDPVLVLGPTVAHQVLRVPGSWAAYFLSALGAGTILGSLVPTRPVRYLRRRAHSHAAAVTLLLLGTAMIVFVESPFRWLTIGAVVVTGAAGLLTGSTAQSLLLKAVEPGEATAVMALWAIAWAGSKPFASLLDGGLASSLGVHVAGFVLAGPAVVIGAAELWLSAERKSRIHARLIRSRLRAYALTR
jgi:predicted MFS family arabinose efflux permease